MWEYTDPFWPLLTSRSAVATDMQETRTRTEEYKIHLTFTTRSHESVFAIAEVAAQIYIRGYCCSTYRPSVAGTGTPPEIEHTLVYDTDWLKVQYLDLYYFVLRLYTLNFSSFIRLNW